MAFLTYSNTPSSAVATNGTIAFTIPASLVGAFQYQGGHVLYAEGLQAQFQFGATGGFTIAWSASTATVTYKGTTSIPANTVVRLQLEYDGADNYLATDFRKEAIFDYQKILPMAVRAQEYRVNFGSPAAASATAILSAVATADTVVHTITGGTAPGGYYQLDWPRGLTIKSSGADTSVITLRGLDYLGNAMSESLTLNGTSAVNGKKAFWVVISYQAGTAMSNNLSIGTQAGVLGLPFFLPGGTGAGAGYVIKEAADGATPTAGTFVGGDLTLATATTGDVRGTYTPNTAPNGTHIYEIVVSGSDQPFLGVPQYAL